MGAPISVVIPTLDRPEELRMCLEGFAGQTAPPEHFEVIVVDDGGAMDLSPIVESAGAGLNVELMRCAHAGIAAARNTGIARARSSLLILYDDDLRPEPGFIAHSLAFHQRHQSERDAALLGFTACESIGAAPVMRWGFGRMYPFPSPGILDWRCFWGGTVTCKKSLFRHGGFNPEYLSVEDAEFAVRASLAGGLRVHFDGQSTSAMTRRATFEQICRRQYLMGYFACRLQRDYPAAVQFGFPPYDRPEAYVIQDRDRLRGLLASANSLELGAETVKRFEMLSTLWTRAEIHVRASGWMDARDGQPPRFKAAL